MVYGMTTTDIRRDGLDGPVVFKAWVDATLCLG